MHAVMVLELSKLKIATSFVRIFRVIIFSLMLNLFSLYCHLEIRLFLLDELKMAFLIRSVVVMAFLRIERIYYDGKIATIF